MCTHRPTLGQTAAAAAAAHSPTNPQLHWIIPTAVSSCSLAQFSISFSQSFQFSLSRSHTQTELVADVDGKTEISYDCFLFYFSFCESLNCVLGLDSPRSWVIYDRVHFRFAYCSPVTVPALFSGLSLSWARSYSKHFGQLWPRGQRRKCGKNSWAPWKMRINCRLPVRIIYF